MGELKLNRVIMNSIAFFYPKRYFILTLFFCVCLAMSKTNVRAAAPQIDEEKVLLNIRKSLSVPLHVEMKITNLQASLFQNFYQGTIQFTSKNNQANQNIFISTDSRYFIVGNLYDVNRDMDLVRRNMINLKDVPYQGGTSAPVIIVEYSDLQCSACKVAHDAFQHEKLIENYAGKVKFVYKNFPLDRYHKWAVKAAVASLCASKQNMKAFWEMQDKIFAQQNEITMEKLDDQMLEFAKTVNLDLKSFKDCYEKQMTLDQVNADVAEGNALGVGVTPTFLVNGRVIAGVPDMSQMKLLIDEFLREKK